MATVGSFTNLDTMQDGDEVLGVRAGVPVNFTSEAFASITAEQLDAINDSIAAVAATAAANTAAITALRLGGTVVVNTTTVTNSNSTTLTNMTPGLTIPANESAAGDVAFMRAVGIILQDNAGAPTITVTARLNGSDLFTVSGIAAADSSNPWSWETIIAVEVRSTTEGVVTASWNPTNTGGTGVWASPNNTKAVGPSVRLATWNTNAANTLSFHTQWSAAFSDASIHCYASSIALVKGPD